ncbi:MAG: carboxypeptidase-like regulatory domain-containing protein [Gaiellaceae bacterium]
MARLLGLAALLALTAAVGGCGGDEADDTGAPVAYEEVQGVFDEYGCTSCHPGVNPSLDLTEGNSYDELVGIQALEDPTLYRVVAGDPERSFLYLKLGGAPPVADIPAIGTRMPPRAPPIAPEDLELVRRWIVQGARGPDGRTGGPQVPTPGTPPGDLDVAAATQTEGSATIAGSVVDQRFDPIEGALVTLLLEGAGQEGGEEHYRVAATDADGRFTLANAPTGQFLLKAYGPDTIYVSRIVALEDGEREDVRFGLPDRAVDNPEISSPRVDGTRLSMTVEGSDLDGNYTLAVNPEAGLVFELHNGGNAPGTWSATIERELGGPWIFLAVDQTCNVSEFLTVQG